MARSKNFDEKAALESAMQLFWQNGYHATSMQQLVDATSLSRSSLYDTFGGKEDLFLAAIEYYLEKVNQQRVKLMVENTSPRSGIESFFNGIIEFAIKDGKKLGCLLTNSAIEFGWSQGKIEEKIFGIFKNVEKAFLSTVHKGQQTGEITKHQQPEELARFLMVQVQGIRVMSRVNPDERWLRDALSVSLGALYVKDMRDQPVFGNNQ